MDSSAIFYCVCVCVCCCSTSLPFIGDLLNPADNILSANDTVEFIFTLDIPDMSGTPFKVSVTTTYNTSSGEQQLVDELDFVIVRPDVNVTTNALSERYSMYTC